MSLVKLFPVAASLALLLLLVSPLMAQESATSSGQPSESATLGDTASGADEEAAASESVEEAEQLPPGVGDFLFTGKFLAFLIVTLMGVALLLGRWVRLWVRLAMLAVAFVLFGLDFFFPLHPSPMCGVTKLFMFKITHGTFFPQFTAVFLAMFIPSLVGRKLFCGWVCPLGALQELINRVPFRYRWKQFDFTVFNSIRMALLVMFVLTIFAVKAQVGLLADNLGADASSGLWAAFSAYSVYEPVNFFELLHWNVDTTFVVTFIILVVVSLMLYRPFCYAVCPIGALTWLLEKIAPGRVRVDHAKCNQCGICVDKSPCPTIAKLIDKTTRVAPDCTSCGECLNTCNRDAIHFRFRA
ncbi:MAG TPA: 4Fe-4S binding protein [Acidobacteriota bacterium]|nr:4Fe-4S binding protein [Acidobacteriota bacterium]